MILVYFFIFLLGLIIGSFLNVVIFRTETEENIVNGRSHCRNCRKDLAWYDLVPLFSFIALKGKCRNCHKKISIQYPLVELATAALFVLSLRATLGSEAISWLSGIPRDCFSFACWRSFAMTLGSTFYLWFIISSLIVIFVYDLKHYIIPDKIVYSAIIVSIIYLIVRQFSEAGLPSSVFRSSTFEIFGFLDFVGNWKLEIGNLAAFFDNFIAAILAGSFFLTIVLLTRGEGMGGGDVKLAFLMGLVLGIDKILISLAVAFTFGAIIGIILIILKKKTLKSAIPFGPFLAIGTIIGLFI